MTYRKKLIEVALPLDAINKESIHEKGNPFLKGHPRNMHQWWSRKPLAACRAVLFASLIDDPSEHPEKFPTEKEQDKERLRLFQLIEALIKWENSNSQEILAKARAEILKSAGSDLPILLDPFCGGGAIALEAQRLGLKTDARDLNPVAVLITKALVEIPPRFVGRPPVHPEKTPSLMKSGWYGLQGLVADICYYGWWVRDEAKRRIGHLYPKVKLSQQYGGDEANVIAWLWVRTVTCPNPACGAQMPLTSKWLLSKKKGKEAWIEPKVEHTVKPPLISYIVKTNEGQAQAGTVSRNGARCIACSEPVSLEFIRDEGKAGHIGIQLIAIVAEGERERVYLSSDKQQIDVFEQIKPANVPETYIAEKALSFRVQVYGMKRHCDLFTPRQLVALTTFSDLVQEARNKVLIDASASGVPIDDVALDDGGTNATAYADAIATYLAFAVDKIADYGNALCTWNPVNLNISHLFTKQGIPMVWDFAEANPIEGGLSFDRIVNGIAESLESLSSPLNGVCTQHNAINPFKNMGHPLICTDPPYYDNIGYGDASDFFYIWLRRSLGKYYPRLFGTLLVPKAQELIASPYRAGGNKEKARYFFEEGLGRAFDNMRESQSPAYPLVVYYAFKQAETEANDSVGNLAFASTGWETMLEGLIKAGFTITGTWPIRTERGSRSVGLGTNALASSIVLVCRLRPTDALVASRRQFLSALQAELPAALKQLQHGSIAPVDLAQASIGSGMSIYSRYSKVVESDGAPLRVRIALQLINQTLDEVLAEQEGEYDRETRWAIAWFEQYAMNAGEYGAAETLSKAKNTGVQALVDAGLLEAKAGKVRLLRREELAVHWNPKASRLTVWEVTQRMIHALLNGYGETGAGAILRQTSRQGEVARDLAYRLYTVCERKGWAREALAYNSLVTSWSEISRLAHQEVGNGSWWEGTFVG